MPRRCIAPALAAVLLAPSPAVAVSAIAVIDFAHAWRIDGGTAPAGYDSGHGGLDFNQEASSAFDAPDATPDAGTTTVVDGSGPANPTVFTGYDRTTRNAGTEGAEANYGVSLWADISTDSNIGNGGSFVELDHAGSAQAQSVVDSGAFAAEAQTEGFNTRSIVMRNLNDSNLFLTITGEMEFSAAVQAVDETSLARSFMTMGLAFDSADPLDIIFAPIGPVEEAQTATGATAASTLFTDFDPENGGLLAQGSASATGTADGIPVEAGATLSVAYALIVTMAPFQQIDMTFSYAWQAAAEASMEAAIPAPAAAPLLLGAVAALGALRRRG